jgi:sorting nexin-29
MLRDEMYVMFKTSRDLSSEFKFNNHFRKEKETATFLFNIVLEIAIRRSTVETWGNIFDKCSQIMAYPDDVVIMGRRLQKFEGVSTSLVENANKMGLEINGKYKKFAILLRKSGSEKEYTNF